MFITIFMIYLWFIIDIWYKMFCYKKMNFITFTYTIFAKIYM